MVFTSMFFQQDFHGVEILKNDRFIFAGMERHGAQSKGRETNLTFSLCAALLCHRAVSCVSSMYFVDGFLLLSAYGLLAPDTDQLHLSMSCFDILT